MTCLKCGKTIVTDTDQPEFGVCDKCIKQKGD